MPRLIVSFCAGWRVGLSARGRGARRSGGDGTGHRRGVFQHGLEPAVIGLDLPADAGGHHRREQPEKAMGFGGCAHRDAGPVPGRLAAGAGVSRATLYRHFASVTDLLDGVAADLLARARFDRLLAALELGDPAEALREVTVAGTGIWAIDTTLVRNLFSLARASPRRSRSSPSSRPGAWAPWSTWPPACSRPAARRPGPRPRRRPPAGHHRLRRLGRARHHPPPLPGARGRSQRRRAH